MVSCLLLTHVIVMSISLFKGMTNCFVMPGPNVKFLHHDTNILKGTKEQHHFSHSRSNSIILRSSNAENTQEPVTVESLFGGDDEDGEEDEYNSLLPTQSSSPSTQLSSPETKSTEANDQETTPLKSTYILHKELETVLANTYKFTFKTTKKAQDIFSQITQPNAKSYILLIQIYGKTNQPQLADDLQNEMLSKYLETNNQKIKPNTVTFTSTIDAWAQSNHPKAAEKAEALLETMIQLFHDKNNDFGKDIQPNSITFDTVLHAFSKAKNKAKPAEAILEQMDFIRRNMDWDVKPTVLSFTNLINAWGNQEGKNAQRAQDIMERMEELYVLTKDKDLKLNTITMNCVMDAWTKESNWQKAMAILTRMEVLYENSNEYQKEHEPGEIVSPNTISYNIALKALVNGKQIRKAQDLFLRMQSFTDPNMMPTTRTYNIMLSGYASLNSSQDGIKDAAKKASLILTKQLALYKQGNLYVEPDTISFSTCMNAIAKSRTYPNKAKKTKEILNAMWELYRSEGVDDPFESSFYPNIITYNTVLNAAAFSAFTSEKEKQEAFLVALSTFNELRSLDDDTIEPDEVTYGNLLKVCANLLPRDNPQRNKMAEQLWKGACEKGLVGDLVWNELKRAVPVELFLKLIPPNVSGRKDLPLEWRENVKVEMMERKRRGKGRRIDGERSRKKTRTGKPRRKRKRKQVELPQVQNVRMTRFTEYL